MSAELVQPLPPSLSFPFNLPTREATKAFGSPSIFRRLRYVGWIKPLPKTGLKGTALYPIKVLVAAQERLERGEMPPLLPSELLDAVHKPRKEKPAPKPKGKGKRGNKTEAAPAAPVVAGKEGSNHAS